MGVLLLPVQTKEGGDAVRHPGVAFGVSLALYLGTVSFVVQTV